MGTLKGLYFYLHQKSTTFFFHFYIGHKHNFIATALPRMWNSKAGMLPKYGCSYIMYIVHWAFEHYLFSVSQQKHISSWLPQDCQPEENAAILTGCNEVFLSMHLRHFASTLKALSSYTLKRIFPPLPMHVPPSSPPTLAPAEISPAPWSHSGLRKQRILSGGG